MIRRTAKLNGTSVHFVFPVYNESENLMRVLTDARRLNEVVTKSGGVAHFLFVDDGSSDNSAQLLRQASLPRLNVLSHPRNLGPGAAFQTAFSHLLSNGVAPDDLVVTLEADATSTPDLFERMLARTEEGDDLVLASVYLYGGGFSEVKPLRVFLSHAANLFVKVLLRMRGIATFSCFCRIYRGNALIAIGENYGKNAIVTLPGFECAVEVLFKAMECGLTISEIPYRVDWSRRRGKSKLRLAPAIWGYFRLIRAFAFRSKRKFLYPMPGQPAVNGPSKDVKPGAGEA